MWKCDTLPMHWRMIELWKAEHVQTLSSLRQCGRSFHFLRWSRHRLFRILVALSWKQWEYSVCINNQSCTWWWHTYQVYTCPSDIFMHTYTPVLKLGWVHVLASVIERKFGTNIHLYKDQNNFSSISNLFNYSIFIVLLYVK